MSNNSKPEKKKARDLQPHRWGMKCFLGEDKTPALVKIVNLKWCELEHNKLWIMLETGNYISADADEELEVYPMQTNEINKQDTFVLRDAPSKEETLLNRLTAAYGRLCAADPELASLIHELRQALYEKEKALTDMGLLLNDLLYGKLDVQRY